jgi:hypothetical protein
MGLDRQGIVTSRLTHRLAPELSQHSITRTAAHVASMAAENTEEEPRTPARDQSRLEKVASAAKESIDTDEDDDDDEVDEEPKLKYSRLTSNLGPVYRNGDATSTFVVAGDKMVRS